jgi:hypothetical protein
MYESMYVFMNVCMYECMYVCMYVCMYESMHLCMNVLMYVCRLCMRRHVAVCTQPGHTRYGTYRPAGLRRLFFESFILKRNYVIVVVIIS